MAFITLWMLTLCSVFMWHAPCIVSMQRIGGEAKDTELNDSDPKNAMGVYTIPKGEQQVTIWIKADDYQGMDGIDYLRTILYPSEY